MTSMAFLKQGFRSLFRQKRRTMISLGVITFGIGCLILTIGHSRYIEWGLRESTIHTETGHLQLFNKDYFKMEEESVLQFGVENYESIRSELMRLMAVSVVLTRIDLMGLISNGDKSVACIGQGVEPELEKRLRGLFRIADSTYDELMNDSNDKEIIALGKALAKSLNVQKGDYVTLMTTTSHGALNAMDLKVVSTFSGFASEYEERAILMPLQTAQWLLDTNKVKNLIVALDKTEKTDLLYEKISQLTKEKGYPVVLKKWQERAQYYKQVKQFYNQITGFLSLVLYIIVFFSTSNTIVMAIIERTKEIGTLLSLGTSRWQTLKMFFYEGLFIGMIGGILSALFAFGLSFFINSFNITLPPPPGLAAGYPLMIRNNMDFYIQIFILTLFITSLSSILPAIRITRMKIIDALGHI